MTEGVRYTLPLEDLLAISVAFENAWPKQKKFFITGGTGFFGRWVLEAACFIEELTDAKNTFYVLSRKSAEQLQKEIPILKQEIFHIIQSDVASVDLEKLNLKCDYVIHAATDVQSFKNESLATHEQYGKDTLRILQYFEKQGLERFLYISSGAVYGAQASNVSEEAYLSKGDIEFTEKPYTNEKRVSEKHVVTSQVPFYISRCFSFVGPYLNPTMAVMEMISNKVNQQEIVVNSPDVIRSYMYPTDFVIQIFKLLYLKGPSEIFNMGSPVNITLGQLAQWVSGGLTPIFLKENKNSPVALASNSYYPNVAKLNKALNITTAVDLETAIKKTTSFELEKLKKTKAK